MNLSITERFVPRLLVAALAVVALLGATPAGAAQTSWACFLSGAAESPPNNSLGTGTAIVDIDDVAHTMRVRVTFSGLTGNTTACHIHAPTATPFIGTAGVATTLPTFAGFPLGVTSGSYDNTLDLTLASSWNGAYITANGGTTAGAEAALIAAITAGRAYLNVHSNAFPGGEVRCFLVDRSTPAEVTTWGRLRSTYR